MLVVGLYWFGVSFRCALGELGDLFLGLDSWFVNSLCVWWLCYSVVACVDWLHILFVCC